MTADTKTVALKFIMFFFILQEDQLPPGLWLVQTILIRPQAAWHKVISVWKTFFYTKTGGLLNWLHGFGDTATDHKNYPAATEIIYKIHWGDKVRYWFPLPKSSFCVPRFAGSKHHDLSARPPLRARNNNVGNKLVWFCIAPRKWILHPWLWNFTYISTLIR